MRLGILGDIHANRAALERVLDFLDGERCVKILCVGDVVGYGPEPEACIRIVRERRLVCVRGNHDHWVGDGRLQWGISPALRASVHWTRRTLSAAALQWLQSLPCARDYARHGISHAGNAAGGHWPYVRDPPSLARNFNAQSQAVCFYGHTHVPAVGIEEAGRAPRFLPLADVVELPPGVRALINPGAVGQPRDGDPRAACAVYDPGTRRVRLVRLVYDIAATQAAMREHELPEHFVERLATGH